ARSLIVGESLSIAAIKAQILKAAPSDATVLITGETGAGKEPVARAIHAGSPRHRGPFVAVNCAALSPALLESDLFGHERGAFTGAVSMKRGRIEAAAGGTLFLDEIGELDPAVQARLLRVLQEREFERVGGVATLRADIRLVAATNRNLAQEVERGSFRKDLYYRIHVVVIHVPPLRERRADIPLLAAHFLSTSAAPAAKRIRGLSPKAGRGLLAYDWPGNVRELQNAIEHAIVFCQGQWIEEEDLPDPLLETAAPGAPDGGYYSSLREAKRRILLAALAECGGSQQQAAKKLGLNPSHMSRLIRNLGLRPEAGSMR
ncbi:MAG: sigma-54 dependent transcriptional regulator, partial [Bryobacteraceae bacterium]|nr:sigma-54 dependent transcriptional regulator [Bryobacteraceae bacterium]